jgi:CheY-like chemotaxis protein
VTADHVRVTVVNDNADFLELMQDLLQDATYPTTTIDGDRDNALELIEASEPELLIIDLRLGGDGVRGLDILRQVRAHGSLSHVPTIICTADHSALRSITAELDAMSRVAVLRKPFSLGELYRSIEQVSAE